jgi:ribonucleoside-diphosphate reductase alpha chain
MFFTDNVNNANPQCYKDLGLLVQASNICTEIMLFTDFLHSFVCCLSSLNLARYDEWKDTNLVQTSILFLDGVIEEFIQKAKDIPGFENSARFAIKSRAIGLGVLGFHTLLQQKGLAFDSMEAHILNSKIFKGIHEKGEQATKTLADLFGEPEWCKGHGRRHTHLFAIAPTASNSIISGGMSSGIEPITANLISKGTAKGTFQIKNKLLEELLETLGENTSKTWKSINLQDGSVQHLNFLTEEQKKIFLTAREIDQMALVRLAAARQKFIDQGQSLNLFFFPDVDQKKLHKIHVEAHKLGIKSLYYTHSNSPLKAPKPPEDCALCEG